MEDLGGRDHLMRTSIEQMMALRMKRQRMRKRSQILTQSKRTSHPLRMSQGEGVIDGLVAGAATWAVTSIKDVEV